MQTSEVVGMHTNKVLFFLDFLTNQTQGCEEQLADLYNRALDENDNVQALKKLLNECIFYGEIGSSLHAEGVDILKEIYNAPNQALNRMPTVRQTYQRIENEVDLCSEMMKSPLPFSTTISVLKKKETNAYMTALKTIASTCVYLMMLYNGVDSIKNLTWDDRCGIQEMIYAVNTKYLPGLRSTQRPHFSWVIRKKKLGGRALFGGEAFYLSYENIQRVDVLCSALHKEPIGTHAFLNIDAYESNELDVPYCWGLGNIVSATPDNAISYLQQDIATGIRNPNWNDVRRKVPTPFECIKQLAGGNRFCISPDELVLIMNQWEMGHEIDRRKQTHNCLFCGKHISGNKMVCDSHFISEM